MAADGGATIDASEADGLRASLARVITAADDERRRIERELHEETQQHLVALAVHAQLVRELAVSDPPAALALLDEVASDAHAALEAVRALAARVYPSLLLDCGLAEALQGAAAAHEMPVRVEIAGLGRYPTEVESTAYFCCVDALDAVAAGGADRAHVRAWQEDAALCLEVGGTAEPLPLLVAATDRLAALGGRLDVVDGGRVSVRIPLAR